MRAPFTPRPSTDGESVREAAARWHDTLLKEPAPADKRLAFAQWLEQAPEHRAAYEAVKNVWALAQNGAHDPRMLALRHETALRITRRSAGKIRRSVWAAAAMICVAIGTLIAIGTSSQMTGEVRSALASIGIASDGRYTTDVGERLVVKLKDGSQVTLNTQSTMEVAFTPGERHLRLTRGQALFEVAKDPSRPFVVEANGRRFVAVGTAFDVRVDGSRVQVTMLEGAVRVERPSDAEQVVATLSAGEQLTVSDRQPDRIRVADPERETSWRRGQLLFENTRLADALAEVNRYSDVRLELADPSLADLRISGAFSTGRPAVFVEALTTYFPIDVNSQSEHRLMLSRRTGAVENK